MAQLGGLALIAEAAEGEHSVLYAGKATTSVTLPQDDKLTLTVEEKRTPPMHGSFVLIKSPTSG